MTTKDLGLLMPMVAVLLPASLGVAQSVNYETVMVGNPGNVADTTGYGAVPYEYLIGKHEVTIGQYTEFLNAVAKNDPYSLWNASMASDPKRAGISRSGTNGAYAYSPKAPAGETPPGASTPGDRPIGWIDWFDAARFANWIHNGQASGNTETGAYTLNGLTGGTARARSPGARFFIPTENEWYKSAYYSPALKSGSGGYFSYATQSNNAPGNIIGSGSNQANYNTGVYSVTQSANFSATQNYLTDVGAFGGAKSSYGTFDQSGNLYEWYDSDAINNASPGIRGGGFESTPFAMSSAYRGPPNALSDGWTSGFRLASSLATTSAYLGTLGQASKWLITGAGAVNAPSFAKNLGRAGDITLTSSGSASGTFVQGASGSQFTGYWHAEQRFFIPANATATSLMFDSLYGNDRVVLRLNTTDVGNANFNAIDGVGVMGLAENTPDVPYNFTQTTSGTQTAGFVTGGWNTLRMIVNNNGTYPTHATPTAPFQFTEDVTNASVNAVLTYAVLPTSVVFNVSSGTQTQEASGYLTLDSSALSVTKSGSGTLVLSGSNSYTGPTVIAGGMLALGNADSLGVNGGISFAGGAMQFTASNATDYSARFSTAANQAYKVDTNGRNVTFASALVSNGGSLTKLGPGMLTLTGSNSYSGGTTISGGTLSIGNGGTAGVITGDIANNGTLVFNRSDASTYSGALSGSGTLVKLGAGTLNLTNTSVAPNTVVLDLTTNVSSGDLQASSGGAELRVGNASGGALNVNGGRVSDAVGWLGYNSGVSGSATVSSGTWANTYDLRVGGSGIGVLNVNGGYVSNTYGWIGTNPGSSGTATVSSGTWENSSDLYVGNSGTGTLSVNAGVVTNSMAYIGYTANGKGTAIIDGGTWNSGNNLFVGSAGTAVLNLSAGAVTAYTSFIGFESAGVGIATVSSGTLASNGQFHVGVGGRGLLTLAEGLVTSNEGFVGYYAGGSGVSTVKGGNWVNASELSIGYGGQGELNIAGGQVVNTVGYVGRNAGSNGVATITGGTLANSGNLTVGVSGTGTLTMTGGLVSVGGTLSKGTYGTVNLQSGGTLQIGTGGTTGVLATDLTNNGTLVFDRSDDLTFEGVLGGVGMVSKQGAGTLTLKGAKAYSGGTRVSGGIIRAESDGAIGTGTVILADSAKRLVLGDGVTVVNNITIDQPVGEVGSGAIQYEGTGTATIASGTITVLAQSITGGEFGSRNGGTLIVESPIIASGTQRVSVRTGTVVFSGGGVYSRFTLHSTAQLGRTDGLSSAAVISMNATQSSNSSIFDLAGYNQTLVGLVNRAVGSAVIANSSTTRNSTLTLTGSSTYSGIIQDTVAGGTKQMCLAVDGGWLGLTGANTMTGSTTVKNGTLQLGHLNALPYSEVSVLAGGTLSLAPGLMTTVGGLKRVGSGVVDVGNGLLTVANGLSAFNLYAGLSLGRGSGAWDGVSGIKSGSAAVNGGLRTVGWLDNGDGSVTFGYAAPGDTNLDWSVDILDLSRFLSGGKFDSSLTATWAEGDFNYDGFVDILDVTEMISTDLYNVGNYNSTPAGTIAAVPEPSTLGLVGVGLGLAGFVAMRRKQAAKMPSIGSNRTAT